MADVTVKPIKNGPYEVSGEISVVDHQGKAYQAQSGPIYLCRCGNSANKPFCDGSHLKVGFKADETAS
jgi:CDGSH iron-sulfur domain-containing protein 3